MDSTLKSLEDLSFDRQSYKLEPLPSLIEDVGNLIVSDLSNSDKQLLTLRETHGKEKISSDVIPTSISPLSALIANINALSSIIPYGDIYIIKNQEDILHLEGKERIVSAMSDKVELIFSAIVDIDRYWSLLAESGPKTNIVVPFPEEMDESHESFIEVLRWMFSSVYIVKPLMVLSRHFYVIAKNSKEEERLTFVSFSDNITTGLEGMRKNMNNALEHLKKGHESFYLAQPFLEEARNELNNLQNSLDNDLFNELYDSLTVILEEPSKTNTISSKTKAINDLRNVLYLNPKYQFTENISSLDLFFEEYPSSLPNIWALWFLWKIPQEVERKKKEKRKGCPITTKTPVRRPPLIKKTDQTLILLGRRIKYEVSPRYTESYLFPRHVALQDLQVILKERFVPWLLDQRLIDSTPVDDIIPSRIVENVGPSLDEEEKRRIMRIIVDFRQAMAVDYRVKIDKNSISVEGLPSYTVSTDLLNYLKKKYRGKQFNRDLYNLFDRYAIYKRHLAIPPPSVIQLLEESYGEVVETFSSPLWQFTNTYFSLFNDYEFGSQGHFFQDKRREKKNSIYLSILPSSSVAYLSGFRSRLENQNQEGENHLIVFSGEDTLNMGQFANIHLALARDEHIVEEFKNNVIHIMLFASFVPEDFRKNLMNAFVIPSLQNALTEDESQALLSDLTQIRSLKKGEVRPLGSIDVNNISSEDRIGIFLQFLRFSEEADEVVADYWFGKIGYKPETMVIKDIETFYRAYFSFLRNASTPEIQSLLDVIQE